MFGIRNKKILLENKIDDFLKYDVISPDSIYNHPIYLEKIKRLVFWAKGIRQYPVMAEISVTNKCNLNCIYCGQNQSRKIKKELGTADWIELIRKLGKANVKRIDVTGGEPLLRKDIHKIFKQIKKEDIEGHLITNGTLFDEELIKLLVEINWDSVCFSLDSPVSRTNDFLRGEGSTKRVIEAIKLFNKYKKNKDSKPYMSFNTVLSNKNFKEIPQLYGLADKLKVDAISILPLVAYNDSGKGLLIKREDDPQKYLKKAYELSKKYNIITTIQDVIDKKLTKKSSSMEKILEKHPKTNVRFIPACFHPFVLLTIKEDGAIVPCPLSDMVLEKFQKNKSLDSVWFGRNFTRFRKLLLKKKLPKCCSICCIPKVLETKHLENQINRFFRKNE